MMLKKNSKKWFKAIKIMFITALVIGGIHLFSMLTWDKVVEYKEIIFVSDKISPELDGYKIAFICDLHDGYPDEKFQPIVDKINDIGVDLVLLGGDFFTETGDLSENLAIIKKINTSDGFYGVAGNHDVFLDLEKIFGKSGIGYLDNSGVQLSGNLFVGGTKDWYSYGASAPEALADSQADDFVILVTHNADLTMQQDTTKADLILSGHTHGGQITFFGIWAPALSINYVTEYGQRFRSGWAKSRDGVPVFVSNGLGSWSSIPRVFARPQVIIITLKSQ